MSNYFLEKLEKHTTECGLEYQIFEGNIYAIDGKPLNERNLAIAVADKAGRDWEHNNTHWAIRLCVVGLAIGLAPEAFPIIIGLGIWTEIQRNMAGAQGCAAGLSNAINRFAPHSIEQLEEYRKSKGVGS